MSEDLVLTVGVSAPTMSTSVATPTVALATAEPSIALNVRRASTLDIEIRSEAH